jgi:hypothetical protein
MLPVTVSNSAKKIGEMTFKRLKTSSLVEKSGTASI